MATVRNTFFFRTRGQSPNPELQNPVISAMASVTPAGSQPLLTAAAGPANSYSLAALAFKPECLIPADELRTPPPRALPIPQLNQSQLCKRQQIWISEVSFMLNERTTFLRPREAFSPTAEAPDELLSSCQALRFSFVGSHIPKPLRPVEAEHST